MPVELIKKIMLTGIGFALKTPSEMQSIAKEVIKQSKMSEKEGKKFIADITKKYEKTRKDVEGAIRKGINEYMASANIASKNELNTVKKEIKKLKKGRKK